MGAGDLPDMYALMHAYQVTHSCPCYNYYIASFDMVVTQLAM